jgi:hypothetical protein
MSSTRMKELKVLEVSIANDCGEQAIYPRMPRGRKEREDFDGHLAWSWVLTLLSQSLVVARPAPTSRMILRIVMVTESVDVHLTRMKRMKRKSPFDS